MITAYLSQEQLQPVNITQKNQALLLDAVWVDLLLPTKKEELLIESTLNVNIPPREELQGIEPSSRLYYDNDSLFMTATMIAKSSSSEPECDAITMIIKNDCLITVRYIEPLAFSLFISHLPKLPHQNHNAIHLVMVLLEATIDRIADITERIGRCLDDYSVTIFRSRSTEKIKLDYNQLLRELGLNGDLNAKAWESLVSFMRLNSFFAQNAADQIDDELKRKLSNVTKDITALRDQVKFLTAKINFLLDATLGMVNIEQNNIIKIFSIAAVIFLPPTLIASVYGMNFHRMPGLDWVFGYPISVGVMIFSGWLPYKYFKMKKWL